MLAGCAAQPVGSARAVQMAALLGPLPEGMVQPSSLGQQIGWAALCRSPAGGAGASVQTRNDLPAELAQRIAATATSAGAAGARLETPAPVPARSCRLYAEVAAVDASLADLVLHMLCYDPAQRITAHQVGTQPSSAG